MTILAPEKPQKWPYLNSRFFFKVSVTQSLVIGCKLAPGGTYEPVETKTMIASEFI